MATSPAAPVRAGKATPKMRNGHRANGAHCKRSHNITHLDSASVLRIEQGPRCRTPIALRVPDGNAEPTISSHEIAQLLGSRHDDVKRSITRLAERGAVTLPATAEVPNRGAGPSTVVEFRVNRRDSYVIVAQLSPQFCGRLVDRWQELETRVAGAEAALPNFADPAAAARAWAIEFEAKRALAYESAVQAKALAIAAPKVQFADAMLNADGTFLVRDAAKLIGVPCRQLQTALKERQVILPNNAPAARYVDRGYLKASTYLFETKTRGTQVSVTTRVTPLGLEFLRRFAARHCAAAGLDNAGGPSAEPASP